MNWLTNVVRPKIRSILKRDTPENLWIKCPDSGQLVFYKDVEANQFVIPGSNYHMRMGAVARLKSIFDNETWYDVALPEVTADPLRFRDERKYVDRIKDARAKTGLNDSVKVGFGKLEGQGVVVAVQDFDFMGGSLGMAPRERIELMRLTARVAREHAIGVLFTEHDMDVVFEHADRILVLNRGALIAEGSPDDVRRDPQVRAIYLGEGLVYDARHREGAGA